MPINTPEVPTTGGCLDSDGFIDGAPFSTHQLRAMTRLANRMTSEEQLLFDLGWSEASNVDIGTTAFEGVAPLVWTRVLPPIPVVKRPGLNQAEVYFRCSVRLGQTVEVFVSTTRRPWRPTRTPDLTITGTGAFEDYTISGIEISEGEEEWFELWVRGGATTTLADTATYGSPNQRSAVLGIYTIVNERQINLSGTGNWNYNAGLNTLAAGGHYILFTDAAGDPIGGPRIIVGHYGSTGLIFEPPLTLRERILADDDENGGATSGDFFIYEQPRYAVAQFAAHAMTRTDGPGLVFPIHGVPHAAATAKALAGCLRAARVYQRTHGRRIGNQNYPIFLRNQLAQLNGSWGIFEPDWVDVARFDDVRIPELAIIMTAHLSWRLVNSAPARVHLRVIVTDGTNTDTGTDGAAAESFEPIAEPDAFRQAFTIWSPGDPAVGETIAQVLISAARVAPGGGVGARTVRVQAFADGGGVAQKVQPGIVTAWWSAR